MNRRDVTVATRAVLATVAVAVGVAVAVADPGTDRPDVTAHGVLPDTAVVNVCESDDTGAIRVAGTVTNPSPARTDYLVVVTMRDDVGALLGTQEIVVNGVEPGKVAGWATITSVAWDDGDRCEVTVGATGRQSVP